jgi:hypothetical protein
MQLNVPPDIETLIKKRLSSGGYATVEEVLRRALSAHIEEGYLQAERGELIAPAGARDAIQAMKESWRREQSLKR